MAAATRYQVTAAAAVVKLKDVKPPEVYVYRGGLVPTAADPEHVKHLLAMGLIKKAVVPEEKSEGTGGAPAGGTDGSGAAGQPPAGDPPAGSTGQQEATTPAGGTGSKK